MKKVPALRFPDFEGEWRPFAIKDTIQLQKKTNLLASLGQPTGLYQFFVCSHDGTHKYLDQYCFDGEYLVINNGGEMYTNYVNDKFAVTSHCLVLKVIKNETKFLYFLLKNKEQQINHFGFQGLAIKNINLNYFLNLKLFFPDNIHEQTKISDFLTLINQKIENIQQQKEKIIQIKKYLLNKMFVN